MGKEKHWSIVGQIDADTMKKVWQSFKIWVTPWVSYTNPGKIAKGLCAIERIVYLLLSLVILQQQRNGVSVDAHQMTNELWKCSAYIECNFIQS